MTARKTTIRNAALLLAALVFTLAAAAAEPAAATLTNADIVSLTRANLPAVQIINRIYAAAGNFDLSEQALGQLRSAGVSEDVVNAMLTASGIASRLPALPQLGAATGAPTLSSSSPSPSSLTPPALTPPSLTPPPALAVPGAGNPALTMPSLGSASDWSDFGRDLANLPPPPALPAFSAPPLSAAATASSGAGAQPAGAGFSAPPATAAPVLPGAQTATAASVLRPLAAPAAAPAAPPSFAPAPAPQAAVADAGRFAAEIAAAGSELPDERRNALAWMLANRQQTLPALRQALAAGGAPANQAGALRALAAMSDSQSLGTIRNLLGAPSPLVRKEAARALAALGDSQTITAAEQNLGNPVEPLDGLIHLVGYARLARAADRLGSILSANSSALNRAAAASALAEIGPPAAAALPALRAALAGDSDGSVRREAVRAVAAFHDPSGAALLMDACRRDPEVRKAALAALADYPEAISFLVGVLGLGPDQIAPDESGAARESLAKLTGQDFGLDGARWAQWLAANPSATGGTGASGGMAGAAPAAGAGNPFGMAEPRPLPPPDAADLLAPAPGAGFGAGATLPVPVMNPGQVDIAALGIIVDPSQIPMAPELEASLGGGPADGVLRVPGAGGGAGAGSGLFQPASGGPSGSGRLPVPAGFEEYADGQMWAGSMPAGGAGAGSGGAPPADASAGGGTLAGAGAGGAAVAGGAGTLGGLLAPSGGAGDASGLRLALPPMPGGGAAEAYATDSGIGAGDPYAAAPSGAGTQDPFAGYGAGAAEPFSDAPWAEMNAGPSAGGDYAQGGTEAYADASGGSFDDYAGGAADDPFAGLAADPANMPAATPYSEPYPDPYADPSGGSFDDDYAGGTADMYADPYADSSGDPFADPYSGSSDSSSGFRLPPPPSDSDGSAGTLAFPGDTEDFGAGEPLFGDGDDSGGAEYADGDFGDFGDFGEGDFGDGGSGESDFGGDDFGGEDFAGGSAEEDGTGFLMPPPPDGGAGTGDFAEYDAFQDASADFAGTGDFADDSAAAPPAEPDPYADYGYGDYNDGFAEDGADFGGADFAELLQETAPPAAAAAPPPGRSATGGTADWFAGSGSSGLGDNTYAPPPGAGTGGATVMEWVRGVGLVERRTPAAALPVPAASVSEPMETIVPSAGGDAGAATEPAAPADGGGWFYVEREEAEDAGAAPVSGDVSGGSLAGTEEYPFIDGDVYEDPAPGTAAPPPAASAPAGSAASSSGAPSRQLRMRR